ncbi:MAG: DUF4870 domain-containing protein [Myxococcota bacterium]
MAEHALTWGETPTSDDKTWALVAHLSPYIATFVGPLLVMLLFSDKSKYVKYHAVQALGYQVAVWILGVIFAIISTLTCGLGSILYLLFIPMAFVPLYGAWVAWEGKWVGYPGIAQFGK